MEKYGSKRRFKAGDTLMKQGDHGESAYIIEEGQVEVYIAQEDGSKTSLGKRGPGTMIGEMALVDNAPRSATVKALSHCKMYEITKDDFTNRLTHADPVLRMTIQIILTRYRDMLARADISYDEAEVSDIERHELHHTQHSDAFESIKLANELEAALDKGETELYYQPIINLQDGKIKGFEALMRWDHKERGFVSPGIFIPIAEESGLIIKASQWAMKEACQALQRINQRVQFEGSNDNTALFMSVNFSGRDFASKDFVEGLYDTISRTDLDPQQLHIEITERMLIDQPTLAKETLEMCAKAGMGVALDDFGTGHSSLTYLRNFPIDTIKIDRSFVTDLQKDKTSMAIVRSVIELGKEMGIHIIAEGIETPEEAETLRDLGCEMAQGFYFCKPMPEIDVISYIVENNDVRF